MQFSLCLLSNLSLPLLCSASLPEMLPDDVGLTALWEAIQQHCKQRS